jgi:hypothetical protein
MNPQALPIKSPCTQDWDAMEGSAKQRYCGECDQTVHNLSAMTRAEAQRVLDRRQSGQRLCVRYSTGHDGEIMFQRASFIPAGLLVRTRQVALGASLAAAAVVAVTDLPGCVPAGPVSGAVAARAVADEAVEQLAEAGTCSISLEPLLPLSLTLHATACKPPSTEPVQTQQGQVPALTEPPPSPAETPPPSRPAAPPPASAAPTQTPVQAKPGRKARAAKKVEPTRPVPEHIMGDLAF